MTRAVSVLAPVLRSETQARLLAALLLDRGRELTIADLARETGADAGNLHGEVGRLVAEGVLRDRRVGRSRLIRSGESPLIEPLASLLSLGYGPKPAAERALRGRRGITCAFIGGSWAARYHGQRGPFPRDIDVIVIGHVDRDTIAEAVERELRGIGHDGQVVFRSAEAWAAAEDAFTRTAKSGPLVELDLTGES